MVMIAEGGGEERGIQIVIIIIIIIIMMVCFRGDTDYLGCMRPGVGGQRGHLPHHMGILHDSRQ